MFSGNERMSTSEKPKHKSRQKTPTHPLLIHKLLYTQRYDHQQCLYALSLVSIVLKDEGRAFICSAATTSMSVCNTPHQSLLRELLIRHRRALSGNEFYGSLADGKNAFFFLCWIDGIWTVANLKAETLYWNIFHRRTFLYME